MKVKLYKGPMHGKTYEVRDDEYEIRLTATPRTRMLFENDLDYIRTADYQTHVYRMVKVGGGVISSRFKMGSIPAVHPDGSVFFEYVPPRKG